MASLYVNIPMPSGTSLSGTPSTLVCQGNIVANCVGNDPPISIDTFIGTVSGNNVQINISYVNTQGTDTITLTGTVSGTSISGTYTDSQGGAGTWTATQSGSPAGTLSGTINSTSNPLTIPPTMTAVITEGQNFALTGTATISNWSCFTSLNFSADFAIGGAFTLVDSTNSAVIIAVPSGVKTFSIGYQVGSSGPECAGDHGTGTLYYPITRLPILHFHLGLILVANSRRLPELRPSVFCSPRSPNKPRECTGKCRQFNGSGLVQTGSGPDGRCKSVETRRSNQLTDQKNRFLLLAGAP